MVFKKWLPLALLLAPRLGSAEFQDPTRPSYPLNEIKSTEGTTVTIVTPPPEPELILSGIWISANSRRATINGKLVGVGQSILNNSVTVMQISPNTVTVKQKGVIKTLRLLPPIYTRR